MYVLIENNSTDNTFERINKFKRPHKVIRVWFRKDATTVCESTYEPIAHVRQLLLTFARQYNPDYAIFLDSDVYPLSKDLIDGLSLWGKDIVGGAYLRPFPEGVFLASKWAVPDRPHLRMLRKKTNSFLEEVLMTSGGCLCLSRKIIQERDINFYPISPSDASEDFGYCLQAKEKGYRIYLDGTVKTHACSSKEVT